MLLTSGELQHNLLNIMHEAGAGAVFYETYVYPHLNSEVPLAMRQEWVAMQDSLGMEGVFPGDAETESDLVRPTEQGGQWLHRSAPVQDREEEEEEAEEGAQQVVEEVEEAEEEEEGSQRVEESEGEEEWAANGQGGFDFVRNGGDIIMGEVIEDDDDDSE